MKTKKAGFWLVVLALMASSLACSLSSFIPSLGGGSSGASGSSGAVTALWADVPKMDGLTVVQQDMPLEARIMIQGVFAAMSGNQGSFAYVAYTTNKSVADVFAFYSPDRMSAAGWDNSQSIGCSGDTSTPTAAGGMCVYTRKTGDNSGAFLAIVPSTDATTKQTGIVFARIDIKELNTPTPVK